MLSLSRVGSELWNLGNNEIRVIIIGPIVKKNSDSLGNKLMLQLCRGTFNPPLVDDIEKFNKIAEDNIFTEEYSSNRTLII